jgi:hypothetical protein
MKKYVALIFFFLAGCFSFGQTNNQTPQMPVDPDSKLIMYKGVVSQEGVKDILYDRGASWFRAYYKSPSSVLKIQDKVNGKLEGLGRFTISYVDEQGNKRDGGMIQYSIKLELKDNKYRYTLTEFNLKAASRYPVEKWLNKNDPGYNPQWDSYLYQIDTTMQSLSRNLKEGMKPIVIKKDEW